MPRILISEDDPNKLAWLAKLVGDVSPGALVLERRSYHGTLALLSSEPMDLVILDMSMPTFDVSTHEAGGEMRAFAGREILREIQRKGIPTRAIVVTQFESFGEGTDRKTLEELRAELKDKFGDLFIGAIFYQPSDLAWQERLRVWLLRALS